MQIVLADSNFTRHVSRSSKGRASICIRGAGNSGSGQPSMICQRSMTDVSSTVQGDNPTRMLRQGAARSYNTYQVPQSSHSTPYLSKLRQHSSLFNSRLWRQSRCPEASTYVAPILEPGLQLFGCNPAPESALVFGLECIVLLDLK